MLDALRAGASVVVPGPRPSRLSHDARRARSGAMQRPLALAACHNRIALKMPLFLQESLPCHIMPEAEWARGPRESLATLFGKNSRKYSLY